VIRNRIMSTSSVFHVFLAACQRTSLAAVLRRAKTNEVYTSLASREREAEYRQTDGQKDDDSVHVSVCLCCVCLNTLLRQ